MSIKVSGVLPTENIREYYERKYNTINSIISTASNICLKIPQLLLSIISTSLTLYTTIIFSSNNALEISIVTNYRFKIITIIYIVCLLVVTIGFTIVFYNNYKRQLLYRKLKEKYEKDLALNEFEKSIHIQDTYYGMLFYIMKKRFLWQNHKKILNSLSVFILIIVLLSICIVTISASI